MTQKLSDWSTGPLPEELEQESLKLFALDHPMHLWPQVLSSTRHDYRARIADLYWLMLAGEGWKLDTAVDQLTTQSLRLLYGDRPVGPTLEQEVRDYAESYLEDLSKVFGDRNFYPKDVAANVAEREAVTGEGRY